MPATGRDGVGNFFYHISALCAGIARNMADPGPYAAENMNKHENDMV